MQRKCRLASSSGIFEHAPLGRMFNMLKNATHFWHAKNLRFLGTTDTRASRSMPSEAKACSKISTLVGIFFSERETPRALACAKRRMFNNAGTKKNQNGVPIKQAGAGIIFTRGWCRHYFYSNSIAATSFPNCSCTSVSFWNIFT